MLITVGSIKGQPTAATTTALGLAAVLPAEVGPVLVECDPSGGDLAPRFGVPYSPGLVELASIARGAARADGPGSADVVGRFARRLPVGDGVSVVCAPPAGAQTVAAVSVLAGTGAGVLSPRGATVLADMGRVEPGSVAWPLLEVADVALLVVRGGLGEIAHLRGLLPDLAETAGRRLAVVLAAGGDYRPAEVAESLHVALRDAGFPELRPPVLGPLPYDEPAARLLTGQRGPSRRWRRSPLLRALDQLGAALLESAAVREVTR